jgi:hypothetical protein
MTKDLRVFILWLTAVLLLPLSSCGPTHTGPTDGIVLYEHPDYKGDSIGFDSDVYNLGGYDGPCGEYYDEYSGMSTGGHWDNCVSSIMVPVGWEVTTYEDVFYRGERLTIHEAIRDLDDTRDLRGDDWDDRITSMRVRPPTN